MSARILSAYCTMIQHRLLLVSPRAARLRDSMDASYLTGTTYREYLRRVPHLDAMR